MLIWCRVLVCKVVRVMLVIWIIFVVVRMLVKVVVMVREALAQILEANRVEGAEVGTFLRSLILLYNHAL